MTGDNGMVQAFPPNTGVGWYTMATGTYPSEHGSTNNTFFRTGDTFSNRTSFSAAGVLQADTIANAAERAGKKVAQIDWVGGAAANINGPTVDFTNFFSNRGVLVGAGRPGRAGGLGLLRRHLPGRARSPRRRGWTSVPTGDPAATPKETTWTINSTFAAQNPNRTYNVYFYDSVTGGGVNYDHAIVSPVGKTGASAVGRPQGRRLPADQADGRQRPDRRARRPDGRPLREADLARARREPVQALRHVARARDREVRHASCNGLPAGGAGEDRLEKYIADNLLPWAAADFAPEEAGVVDEDTYVQQGRDLERAYSLQVINYILGTLQPDTDLAMVGYPFTDEVSHQFMGLVTPTDAGRRAEPVLRRHAEVRRRPVHRPRHSADRVAIREELHPQRLPGRRREARHHARADGRQPDDVRRLRPRLRAAVLRRQREQGALRQDHVGGVRSTAMHTRRLAAREQRERRRTAAPPTDRTSRRRAGPAGRSRSTSTRRCRPGITYDARSARRSANAFQNLTDPANPGKQVILKIMNKEELRNVDGSDSLHPNRSGDVVVVPAPAVPVGRGHERRRRSRCRTSSGSTATCRTTSTSRTTSTCTRRSSWAARASSTRTTSRACARSTSRRRSRS